jgi:hypothetical protein
MHSEPCTVLVVEEFWSRHGACEKILCAGTDRLHYLRVAPRSSGASPSRIPLIPSISLTEIGVGYPFEVQKCDELEDQFKAHDQIRGGLIDQLHLSKS